MTLPTGGPSAAALAADDVAHLHDVRVLLDAAAYGSLSPSEAAADLADVPALAYKYRDARPLATLVRLFALGLEVDAAALAGAASADQICALVALGFLQSTGTGWRSTVKLWPFAGAIVVCDFSHRRDAAVEPVYAPGADSTWLVKSGIRRPFARALDLCTGSGIQAVVAAQHAASVTAVDLNPRAVHFARLSLALNGIGHAGVRQGDLYEAVPGESFDFITANPPFVITPHRTHLFRDGGVRGAETLRRVLDGLPQHLREGGYAQIVTFLHDFENHSQLEEIRAFAEQQRMEALVCRSEPMDKHHLATTQLRRQLTNYATYSSSVHEYLKHLDDIRLVSYVSAVITFRRSGRYAFETKYGLQRVVTFDADVQSHLRSFYGLV